MEGSNREEMEALFANRFGEQQQSYENHLLHMQNAGVWGTEQEIIAAAHLFDCSLVCMSQYGSSWKFCLQHFPPHFAQSQTCNNTCRHNTLYLVNNSNVHYDLATVHIDDAEE